MGGVMEGIASWACVRQAVGGGAAADNVPGLRIMHSRPIARALTDTPVDLGGQRGSEPVLSTSGPAVGSAGTSLAIVPFEDPSGAAESAQPVSSALVHVAASSAQPGQPGSNAVVPHAAFAQPGQPGGSAVVPSPPAQLVQPGVLLNGSAPSVGALASTSLQSEEAPRSASLCAFANRPADARQCADRLRENLRRKRDAAQPSATPTKRMRLYGKQAVTGAYSNTTPARPRGRKAVRVSSVSKGGFKSGSAKKDATAAKCRGPTVVACPDPCEKFAAMTIGGCRVYSDPDQKRWRTLVPGERVDVSFSYKVSDHREVWKELLRHCKSRLA